MSEPEQINLRTERDSQGLVKVVWSDGSGASFKPYHLYLAPLQKAAEAARASLDRLGRVYRQPTPDFLEALTQVAEKGKELRDALFQQTLPEERREADDVLRWFESLTKDRSHPVTVNVHADPILHVPWGLLHDTGSEGSLDGPTADLYGGFWAPRYAVVTLYNGMKPHNLKAARPVERVRLLAALHEQAFSKTREYLDVSDQRSINDLLDRPVGKASTIQGCRERWQQIKEENDCLIYFFCHASGAGLCLGEDTPFTASMFRNVFDRRESGVVAHRSEPAYVLTFLNGCSTGNGNDSESFLVATANPGFCGFVGVEAPVPDRFALLFGHEFLHALLLEGQPVREAMRTLWRKHQPMALFYGCCANPYFRIGQAEERLTPSSGFEDRNLSYYHPIEQPAL